MALQVKVLDGAFKCFQQAREGPPLARKSAEWTLHWLDRSQHGHNSYHSVNPLHASPTSPLITHTISKCVYVDSSNMIIWIWELPDHSPVLNVNKISDNKTRICKHNRIQKCLSKYYKQIKGKMSNVTATIILYIVIFCQLSNSFVLGK